MRRRERQGGKGEDAATCRTNLLHLPRLEVGRATFGAGIPAFGMLLFYYDFFFVCIYVYQRVFHSLSFFLCCCVYELYFILFMFYIHLHSCVCVCVYTLYVYIHVNRQIDRKRDRDG